MDARVGVDRLKRVLDRWPSLELQRGPWGRAALLVAALALLGVWVDLVGYGTAFLDPASTSWNTEANRYAYQAGRLAIVAFMIAAPGLFDHRRASMVTLALLMSFMTGALAVSTRQTLFPVLWVSTISSFVLCATYTWATAACYVELAKGFNVATAIASMALAQVLEQLSFLVLNEFLPGAVQVVLCMAIPPVAVALVCVSGRGASALPKEDEVTGQAKYHVLMLLGVAGIAVTVMGAVSDVGIWGSPRMSLGAESFGESAATVVLGCIVMVVLVACTLLRFTNAPLGYRYQVPFLVIIAGYMLALARDIYPGLGNQVEALALTGIEFYAHVLTWTVFVATAQVVRTPFYRCAGIIGAAGGTVSLAWVVILENNRPIAGLVVLVLICAIIIATAVHPRLMYERSSAQATTREALNEYAIEGESELPLGVNAVVVKGAVEERSAVMAQKFGLSPREGDVLVLLIQGRTVSAICQKLQLSEGTVKTHIAHIYDKTSVHSRQELLDLAYGGQIRLH